MENKVKARIKVYEENNANTDLSITRDLNTKKKIDSFIDEDNKTPIPIDLDRILSNKDYPEYPDPLNYDDIDEEVVY